MPPKRVTTPKKSAPTVVSAAEQLRDSLEAVGPLLDGWLEKVNLAVENVLNLAGVGKNGTAADSDDDEDEAPKARAGKTSAKTTAKGTGKAAAKDDDEDDDDDDEPNFAKMDEDDLAAFNKKHKLGVKLAKLTTVKKQRAAVQEAYEESMAESGDDDEGDEPPDFDAMDEEDLTDFVSENGLDLDLDSIKSLKKQRAAVAKAYAEAQGGDDDDEDGDSEDESW